MRTTSAMRSNKTSQIYKSLSQKQLHLFAQINLQWFTNMAEKSWWQTRNHTHIFESDPSRGRHTVQNEKKKKIQNCIEFFFFFFKQLKLHSNYKQSKKYLQQKESVVASLLALWNTVLAVAGGLFADSHSVPLASAEITSANFSHSDKGKFIWRSQLWNVVRRHHNRGYKESEILFVDLLRWYVSHTAHIESYRPLHFIKILAWN